MVNPDTFTATKIAIICNLLFIQPSLSNAKDAIVKEKFIRL